MAPLRVFLVRKAANNAKKMNINGIISYLKSQYSTDNRDQITFIQNFLSQRNVPSFEETSEELKAISKSMKEDENMSRKNKALFGGWMSVAKKAKKDLPRRFDNEYTRSRPITEVKHCRVGIVLGWGTAWELRVS